MHQFLPTPHTHERTLLPPRMSPILTLQQKLHHFQIRYFPIYNTYYIPTINQAYSLIRTKYTRKTKLIMLASTRVVLEIGFKYYELKILLSFIINLVMHKVRRTISSAPYCDTEFSFTSLFSLEMNTSHTTRDEHILSGCIFTNDKARCNTSNR